MSLATNALEALSELAARGNVLELRVVDAGDSVNIEVAAAGNTEVVEAKLNVMQQLDLAGDGIEDILITLRNQYHLIRPLSRIPNLFLYLAIDRKTGNLGLARHRLAGIESEL